MKRNQITIRAKDLILFIFILVSCKSQNNNLYQFDPTSIEKNNISLSEIADDVTYIPLDNTLPLGLIYKYEFVNNSIYLSTKDLGILVYSRSGKFIRRIGKIGRGPGEYIYPMHFTVNNKTETTYVLDGNGIIKIYSKTGRFLRSLLLTVYGESTDDIDLFDSKLFIHYMLQFPDKKYDWIVLDSLGNLLKKKDLTFQSITTKWGEDGGTYRFEDNLYYWNPFNDTVFSILPDLRCHVSFLIKPGEHRFPIYDVQSFEQFAQYMHLQQIFESKKFIVIRYHYKENYLVLINKSDSKSYLMRLEYESNNVGSDILGGILNNFDGGIMLLPDNYFAENDREFVSALIGPYKIKTLVSGFEFRNSSPKNLNKKKIFEELAYGLKETDNPVLMVVRLKK